MNNTSKLASVNCYKKYGVERSLLTYIVHNNFYVTDLYRDCLDTYYILRWQASHMLSSITNGTLVHKGVTYQVIYHRTDPTRIKRAALLTHCIRYVKLSFRVAQPEFNIPATVLIKLEPVKGDTNNESNT